MFCWQALTVIEYPIEWSISLLRDVQELRPSRHPITFCDPPRHAPRGGNSTQGIIRGIFPVVFAANSACNVELGRSALGESLLACGLSSYLEKKEC